MTDSPSQPRKNSSGITVTVVLTIVIIIFIGYQLKKPPRREPATPPAVNHPNIADSRSGVTATTVQLRENRQKPAASTQKAIIINDHIRAEINDFLKSWLLAWKKSAGGNLKPYFAHYAQSFRTKFLGHQAWKNAKSIRNRGKSWIDISIKNLKIHPLPDNRLRLIFDQEYSSSNFSDQSRKELILQKTAGRWLISGEQELGEHEITAGTPTKNNNGTPRRSRQ
ncbi:L,D-transpeptidase Cds6 family protein [Desulfobacterota bacterium M19]